MASVDQQPTAATGDALSGNPAATSDVSDDFRSAEMDRIIGQARDEAITSSGPIAKPNGGQPFVDDTGTSSSVGRATAGGSDDVSSGTSFIAAPTVVGKNPVGGQLWSDGFETYPIAAPEIEPLALQTNSIDAVSGFREVGLFENLQNIASAYQHDKIGLGDALSMGWDNAMSAYRGSQRAQGAVQAVNGGLEVAGATLLDATAVGGVVGVPLAFHGGDNLGTGIHRLWTGEPSNTVTYNGVAAMTGSQNAAAFVDSAIPFAGGAADIAAGISGVAKTSFVAENAASDLAALRTRYANEIDDASTFQTNGLSTAAADRYLSTSEGQQYISDLRAASPSADADTIYRRALSQMQSGASAPSMQSASGPLVKIVPQGESVSDFSPYFTTVDGLQAARASGQNLADYFGLPIKSEAPVYDIYQITPNVPSNVYVSQVAPTSELGGLVQRAGGAPQALVVNRGKWTSPELVGTIMNQWR